MLFIPTPEKKLIKAAGKGKLEEVRKLLEAGADINASTAFLNWTPLITAAEKGHIETMKLLIDKGAALDKGDGLVGWTALMMAIISGRTEAAKLLIDRGASLSATDSQGRTARDWAASKNRKDILVLIDAVIDAKKKKAAEVIAGQKREEQERQLRAKKEALKPEEKWVMMGTHQIAFIGTYPEAEKTLTHIFNFADRCRLTTIGNMKTNTETPPATTGFDELTPSELEKAFEAFSKKGGVADRSFVFQGIQRMANKSV